MEQSLIKEQIIRALANVYVFIDIADERDINLEDYIEDSIQFMSFVVELEKTFDIEIPPELMVFDRFKTIEDAMVIVEELASQK